MLLKELDFLSLAQLVDLCRALGIKKMGVREVHFELGEMPAKEINDTPLKDEADKPCLCGHESYEHNSLGSCLHGCTHAACIGKEE